MTEKLYYNNPYLKSWEARILDIIEKEEKYIVLLDKTAFYPEGGGQPCDKGYIDGIPVLEVFEENKDIYHVVPQKPGKECVSCVLDFERRQDLMQQHTGQHLLSSVFFDNYKGETSSFHLGMDYVSIDISLSDITDKMSDEVELKVNELICNNLEVKTYFVEKENLDKLPLRKFPKVEEDIRIVEIDKIDYSPCCGTHVSRTGELGIIKIVKTEKYKGATRVYFKCGKRALLDFQKKQDNIMAICRLLSVDLDNLKEKVQGSIEELRNNTKEIRFLKENLYFFEAGEIVKAANSSFIIKDFKDRSFNDIQDIGKAILQTGEYILVLSSLPDKKIWFAYSGNYEINCGRIFKENLQKFNGRGGGGEKQAQCSFENEDLLKAFESFLKDNIKIHKNK